MSLLVTLDYVRLPQVNSGHRRLFHLISFRIRLFTRNQWVFVIFQVISGHFMWTHFTVVQFISLHFAWGCLLQITSGYWFETSSYWGHVLLFHVIWVNSDHRRSFHFVSFHFASGCLPQIAIVLFWNLKSFRSP